MSMVPNKLAILDSNFQPINSSNPFTVSDVYQKGFGITYHDYIAVTYPTTSSEVYTFKVGGASGTTIAVLTLTYSSSAKDELISVARS